MEKAYKDGNNWIINGYRLGANTCVGIESENGLNLSIKLLSTMETIAKGRYVDYVDNTDTAYTKETLIAFFQDFFFRVVGITEAEADLKYVQIDEGEPFDPDTKADVAGDTYTGTHDFTGATITAPTKAVGTNSTDVATMAALQTAINQSGLGRKIFPVSGSDYAFPYENTGDITENTKLSVTVPANTVGTFGRLEFIYHVSCTSNANAKQIRLKVGSTVVSLANVTSSAGAKLWGSLQNNESLSINSFGTAASIGGVQVGTTYGVSNPNLNTGADITFTITMQNGVAGDTFSLQSFVIIAYY